MRPRWQAAKVLYKRGFRAESSRPKTANNEAHARHVLGVPHDATLEQIKEAYREKAKKVHPDNAYGSNEAFKQVSWAYTHLVQSHIAPTQRTRADLHDWAMNAAHMNTHRSSDATSAASLIALPLMACGCIFAVMYVIVQLLFLASNQKSALVHHIPLCL